MSGEVGMNRRNFIAGAMNAAAAAGAGAAMLPRDSQANHRLARQKPASELTELSIEDASKLIQSRALSPVELLHAYLERIHRFNAKLNAFILVTEDLAYEQACQCEAEIAAGRWRGPLHGIPFALKDNMDTQGIRTTAGSAVFLNRVPTEDCEVVRRLKHAGAVLLGKTNMQEFAYGDTTFDSYFGPTHNPWHYDHVPGGSSGGSAAAVAAHLCAAALGTDTGGSVRQPAAHCGVVGLKPTYGLASIRGIIPLAETQDYVGPICRTVADTALVLQVLAGYDSGDLGSIKADIPDYKRALATRVSSLRIGVPRKLFYEELDSQVAKATEAALEVIAAMTAVTREVTVSVPPLRVLAAEAYAWHRKLLESEATRKLYQPRTLDRLMKGADISASTYIEARRQQLQSRRDIERVFEEVDLLITPTCPQLPVTLEEARNPSSPPGFTLRNTAPFNANGIPAISVPCGFSDDGLPIGLQVSGPRLAEVSVLVLAHAYEQSTEWHKKRPALAS